MINEKIQLQNEILALFNKYRLQSAFLTCEDGIKQVTDLSFDEDEDDSIGIDLEEYLIKWIDSYGDPFMNCLPDSDVGYRIYSFERDDLKELNISCHYETVFTTNIESNPILDEDIDYWLIVNSIRTLEIKFSLDKEATHWGKRLSFEGNDILVITLDNLKIENNSIPSFDDIIKKIQFKMSRLYNIYDLGGSDLDLVGLEMNLLLTSNNSKVTILEKTRLTRKDVKSITISESGVENPDASLK